jgi:hypothetical protein
MTNRATQTLPIVASVGLFCTKNWQGQSPASVSSLEDGRGTPPLALSFNLPEPGPGLLPALDAVAVILRKRKVLSRGFFTQTPCI